MNSVLFNLIRNTLNFDQSLIHTYFSLFQARNRLSVRLKVVTEDLPTPVIERNICMFIPRINLTTAELKDVIKPTPIRPLSVSI